MRITDIFDAVRDATYSDFRKFYTGDPNLFHKYTGLSLFQLLFVNDHNTDEKIKMIRFLISEGADVNFKSPKDQRNALHIFYFSVMRPDPQYILKVTQLLVEAGVNINAKDKGVKQHLITHGKCEDTLFFELHPNTQEFQLPAVFQCFLHISCEP